MLQLYLDYYNLVDGLLAELRKRIFDGHIQRVNGEEYEKTIEKRFPVVKYPLDDDSYDSRFKFESQDDNPDLDRRVLYSDVDEEGNSIQVSANAEKKAKKVAEEELAEVLR